MLPELGLEDGPVSALLADRPTECFLRGAQAVKAVPGVNVLFPPPTTPAQASWNARIRAAARASRLFPDGHHLTNDRIFPRQSGFFSREDVCAVGTRVVPLACSETGESVHAIFSLFDDAAPPPVAAAAGVPAGGVAAGVAPADDVVESTSSFFFVDAWFSGLSAATPNAPVTAKLTLAEQNDPARAVDLALGRIGAVVEDAPPASRIFDDSIRHRKPVPASACVPLPWQCGKCESIFSGKCESIFQGRRRWGLQVECEAMACMSHTVLVLGSRIASILECQRPFRNTQAVVWNTAIPYYDYSTLHSMQ